MAQSPLDTSGPERPENSPYLKAWTAINELLREGHSWSGNERNCFFWNTGGQRFADVSAVSAFDFPDDGRGMCLTDWDHDGDLDVWHSNRTAPAVRFLRNDWGGHHFLALRLTGRTCNRDAIGARLELHREGQPVLIKTLRAGEGYLSQSSKWIHFGLGEFPQIDRVVIRWPGREPQEVRSLTADRFYTIEQGAEPVEWRRPKPPTALASETPTADDASSSEGSASSLARAVLTPPRPTPPLEYRDLNGRPRLINDRSGKPLLINVWATWCKPCVEELTEFARHADQLRDSGVEVVAINVDGIAEGGESDPKAVKQLLERLRFPFRSGTATPELASAFQNGPALFLDRASQLPIPSSFLLDASDRMAIIYSGPVSVDQLMRDVALVQAGPAQLAQTALPFPGLWVRPVQPTFKDLEKTPSNVKATQPPSTDAWFYILLAVVCCVTGGLVGLLLRKKRD